MSVIVARLAIASDIPFIKDSWKYSYFNDNTLYNTPTPGGKKKNRIPKDLFMKGFSAHLDKILTNESNLTYVACLEDDPNTIVGFSCFSPTSSTLHYVYIKKMWRGNKIHEQILPETLQFYTHSTYRFEAKRPKEMIFNPFIP